MQTEPNPFELAIFTETFRLVAANGSTWRDAVKLSLDAVELLREEQARRSVPKGDEG